MLRLLLVAALTAGILGCADVHNIDSLTPRQCDRQASRDVRRVTEQVRPPPAACPFHAIDAGAG